jgi:hypothetical protein
MIDVLLGPRYSGHVDAVWMGGEVRVVLPVDAWGFGVWARYEMAVATLQAIPVDFHMFSGSIGLSAGYRFLSAPLQLTAAFEPSLAIIGMDGGPDGDGGVDAARADPRIGTRFQAALPIGQRWRALFALDGEIAPYAIASEKHRTIASILPPIPSFTLGASIGGEIVVR